MVFVTRPHHFARQIGLRISALGARWFHGFPHWNRDRERLLFVVLWHSEFDIEIGQSKVPVAEVTQDGVRVSILSADGQIHAKDNAYRSSFRIQADVPSTQKM
jgi:hypothetical protein